MSLRTFFLTWCFWHNFNIIRLHKDRNLEHNVHYNIFVLLNTFFQNWILWAQFQFQYASKISNLQNQISLKYLCSYIGVGNGGGGLGGWGKGGEGGGRCEGWGVWGGEKGGWGVMKRFLKCLLGWEDGRGWLVGCWLPPQGGSLERVAVLRGRLLPEAVQLEIFQDNGIRRTNFENRFYRSDPDSGDTFWRIVKLLCVFCFFQTWLVLARFCFCLILETYTFFRK